MSGSRLPTACFWSQGSIQSFESYFLFKSLQVSSLILLSSLSVHTMIWIFKAQMPLKVQFLLTSLESLELNLVLSLGNLGCSEGLFISIFSLTIQLSIHSCFFMQLAQRHLHFIPPSLWFGCFTPHSSDKLHSFFFPPHFFPPFMVSLEVCLFIKFVWYCLQELHDYRCGFMKMKFL